MKSWREQFLREIRSTRARRTAEAYGESVKKFEAWLEHNGLDVQNAPDDVLQKYVEHCVEQGDSANTIHWRMSGVRRYITFCAKKGIRAADMPKPELPRVRVPERAILTPVQLAAYMHEAGQTDEPYSTALRLLPLTGLRRAEMAQLKISDLTLQPTTSFHIHKQKDVEVKGIADRRVVPIDEGVPILRSYLVHIRPQLPRNAWLFPWNQGRITARALGDQIRKIRGRLGFGDLSTHTLRHCYATSLRQAGVPDSIIQKLLGHANMTTTSKYLHPSVHDLADAVRGVRAPWARVKKQG